MAVGLFDFNPDGLRNTQLRCDYTGQLLRPLPRVSKIRFFPDCSRPLESCHIIKETAMASLPRES